VQRAAWEEVVEGRKSEEREEGRTGEGVGAGDRGEPEE